MTNTPQGSSRARSGQRLTLVAATAACLLALPGTGVAQAQTTGGAAGSQYTVPSVTTTITPTTASTTPDTGVADNGGNTSTGDGSGDATEDDGASNGTGTSGSGTGTGSNGSGTGSSTGAGTGNAGDTATNPAAVPVDYAAFGRLDRRVRNDIREALERGNLLYRYVKTTDKRLNSFIAGSVAKQLSTTGPRALGTRVGTELTGTGSLAPTIFRAIFGRKFEYRPFSATVLSRGDTVSADQVKFLTGLAGGFGAKPIPTVYVERSDDKKPHTDEFENIPGVSIVDDIDTPAGKAELIRLLTSGTNAAVASTSGGGSEFSAQNRAAIANVGDDSSSSMPTVLLALLVLGGVVFTGGTLVRRRR